GNAGLGNGSLGTDDALADGGFGGEEGAGDLFGGEPAQQAQSQRYPRFRRQDGVAGGKDQPQQIVADLVIQRLDQFALVIGGVVLYEASNFLQLGRGHFAVAEIIDAAPLGGLHQPGAGIVRHAGFGPGLERDQQGVLCQFLGQRDVAHHARQSGDQPRLLDLPDAG